MAIERQNILNLIGRNKGKYTSCIITCYSFDFLFFEERVMTALRLANVKNVNVFVDGKCVDRSLENSSGREFKTHRTYSYIPITIAGVFHPKIMLLTGASQGLLLIGSGNITSSGLSTNDEVWGAFQLNGLQSDNSPVFASAWNYLSGLFNYAHGFNINKLKWITQYSPWLNQLDTNASNDFIKLADGLELKFISDGAGSIYSQLLKSIPRKVAAKLTVVSPYYDLDGKVIQQLLEDITVLKIDCISDVEFGQLPTKIPMQTRKQVSFFDWQHCTTKDFDVRYNRLHAKLIHFSFADGLEYLFLGSANATIQAFGSKSMGSENKEVGLLIKRKSSKNYLDDLGIKVKSKNLIDLDKLKSNKTLPLHKELTKRIMYRIFHAELLVSKITIFFDKELVNCFLILIDSNNHEIDRLLISKAQGSISVESVAVKKVFKVFLSLNDQRVSNFSFVHNVESQIKTNPDSALAELNGIIEALSADPENDQYINLLKYVDYSILEGLTTGSKIQTHSTNAVRIADDEKKEYASLSEDDFNKLKTAKQFESDLFSNPSLHIADILSLISQGIVSKGSVIVENDEELLAKQSEGEQSGIGGEILQIPKINVKGREIQRAINRHLQKINEFYSSQLFSIKKDTVLQSSPKRNLTLIDLSNALISFELILIFQGRTYQTIKTVFSINFRKDSEGDINEIEKAFKLMRLTKTDPQVRNRVFYEVDSQWLNEVKTEFENRKDGLWVLQSEYEVKTYNENYFLEGQYSSETKYGLKQHLIDTLGSFLINANLTAAFFKYDEDLYNERTKSVRMRLFTCATFLCLNIQWMESERKKSKLLLLDLLCHIYPSHLQTESIVEIKEAIRSCTDTARYINPFFYSSLVTYIANTIPAFIHWKSQYQADSTQLSEAVSEIPLGSIVYNRNIGFAELRGVGKGYIILSKPGFGDVSEELGENTLKLTYPQQKVVVFSTSQ